MPNQLRFILRRFPFIHRLYRQAKAALFEMRVGAFYFIGKLPPPFSLGLPRGSYSDLDLLSAMPPALSGRLVLSDQGNPVATPDSVMVRCGRGQQTEQPWSIFWTHHRQVELVGGSLAHINKAGELCVEAVYGKKRLLHDPAFSYRRRGKPLELTGNWTSLISRWNSVEKIQPYGDWLLDALPRLALLEEFPDDTKILIPPHGTAYQKKSLEMLGLTARCRPTREMYITVENYFFSSPKSMIGCYDPYGVNWLRTKFLPLADRKEGTTPKRFFCRRRGNIRNITNEAEVLLFFQDLGWDIVDPGDFSFAEQVALFSSAEAICAIHGSGFNNVVWCQPGCRLLELFSAQHVCGVAEWVSQCIPSLEHRYLIFPSDHRLNAIVDLPTLKSALESFIPAAA